MPLITISESLGSGGRFIARQVADRLNIDLYDDDRLQSEAVTLGIGSKELKNLDEKAPGLFDQILGRRPDIYMNFMEALVYEVAKRGDGIIIGHCSQMLLQDFSCALHARIHCSMASRIRNLSKRQGIDPDSAKKLIHKSDHQRKGFFKFAFQMDLDDSSLYDLVLNPEKVGDDTAVQLIVDLATSEEIKACSLTALETMERLALKKKVHAELLKNKVDIRFINIDIPKPGVVKINGMVATSDEQARLAAAVESVAGVSSVQLKITLIPTDYA